MTSATCARISLSIGKPLRHEQRKHHRGHEQKRDEAARRGPARCSPMLRPLNRRQSGTGARAPARRPDGNATANPTVDRTNVNGRPPQRFARDVGQSRTARRAAARPQRRASTIHKPAASAVPPGPHGARGIERSRTAGRPAAGRHCSAKRIGAEQDEAESLGDDRPARARGRRRRGTPTSLRPAAATRRPCTIAPSHETRRPAYAIAAGQDRGRDRVRLRSRNIGQRAGSTPRWRWPSCAAASASEIAGCRAFIASDMRQADRQIDEPSRARSPRSPARSG